MDLEAAMEEIGHRVLGIASTRDEALRMIAGRKPGLLLVDIQLADGSSGIDTANDMLTNFSAPTIFITAFPERLLTGEKPEPVFLITKPFDVDIVKAVTSQALFFDQKATKSVV
jgi:DNA-binding LytR/AlgR family response regulator